MTTARGSAAQHRRPPLPRPQLPASQRPAEVEGGHRYEARSRAHLLLQPAAVDRLDEDESAAAVTRTSLQPSTAPEPSRWATSGASWRPRSLSWTSTADGSTASRRPSSAPATAVEVEPPAGVPGDQPRLRAKSRRKPDRFSGKSESRCGGRSVARLGGPAPRRRGPRPGRAIAGARPLRPTTARLSPARAHTRFPAM